MPQLNPNPWFAILIFTWMVFLYFLPTKVMGHTYPSEQTAQIPHFAQPENWPWPWL
uniref:ATP synthase complex subunit 8 n=1 Tax=Holacanthus ciliaris TaxID=75024 RepID=A0A023I042_9TELE|nr:ATP synthase F0 subunit 8 [Holacanthus ciliaris]AGR91636.1 ATP synthetase subunit 8 [Holacanthus ciliaris]AKQ08976.1 ATP synthase F0 subunit 8 [Holacanthus ciliaris]QUJ18188.1 ATP synthase protein 8 [Holacanthus ciliaris]